VKWHIYE